MARGRQKKEPGFAETIECTVCQTLKIRINAGEFENGRTRFLDQNGRPWNGHTCGDCNLKRIGIYSTRQSKDKWAAFVESRKKKPKNQ